MLYTFRGGSDGEYPAAGLDNTAGSYVVPRTRGRRMGIAPAGVAKSLGNLAVAVQERRAFYNAFIASSPDQLRRLRRKGRP